MVIDIRTRRVIEVQVTESELPAVDIPVAFRLEAIRARLEMLRRRQQALVVKVEGTPWK